MTRVIPLDVVRRALACRQAVGIGPAEPVDVYRVADIENVDVRFLPVNSLEGMYVSSPKPTILLPAERPYGRTRFSCAHELGHHKLGHGTTIDLLQQESRRGGTQEMAADLFAGHLLMPKLAVARGFSERGWKARDPAPDQVLRVAQWLGVGYTALLRQMLSSLDLLSRSAFADLKRSQPREIARSLLARTVSSRAVFLDELWQGQAVEIAVGEVVASRGSISFEGPALSPAGAASGFSLLTGRAPGVARLIGANLEAFVKVSRPGYVGLAKYRHLRDPEYEPPNDNRNR